MGVEVTGAFPERLLNLCAQNRLQFWKLCWLDETSFTFRVALKDRRRLDELAQEAEDAASDYLKLQDLYKEREAVEDELAHLYAEWERLAAELEEARG